MPNSAEAMAREIVGKYEAGFIGKTHQMVRRPGLVKLIADALTTFAAEQVQARQELEACRRQLRYYQNLLVAPGLHQRRELKEGDTVPEVSPERVGDLVKERDTLQTAVRTYGRHLAACPQVDDYPTLFPCSCGFSDEMKGRLD